MSAIYFTDDEGEQLTNEDIHQLIEDAKEEALEEFEEESQEEESQEEESQEEESQEEESQEEESQEEEVKPERVYTPKFIRELRKIDSPGKTKTCAKCARRLPIIEIRGNEICDSCADKQ